MQQEQSSVTAMESSPPRVEFDADDSNEEVNPSNVSPPRPASASSTRDDEMLPITANTRVDTQRRGQHASRTAPQLSLPALPVAAVSARRDPLALALAPGLRVSRSAHIVLPPRRHAEMLDAMVSADPRMNTSVSASSTGSASISASSSASFARGDRIHSPIDERGASMGSTRIPSQASAALAAAASQTPPPSFFASPRAEAASIAARSGHATARNGV